MNREALTRGAGMTVFILLLTATFLAISFFVTTYLAMITGGILGHFFHSTYLMKLSFWQYSPIWLVAVIVKAIF